jgi:hypothetical protein
MLTFALAVAPSDAGAAATLVGQTNGDLIGPEIDGENVYWSNGSTVTRANAVSGLGGTVYRKHKKTRVTEIASGGGQMTFATVSETKKTRTTTAYLFDAASGVVRRLTSGKEKLRKGATVCGSVVTLGRITAAAEALVIKTIYSPGKKPCGRRLTLRSTVTGFAPAGSRQLFSGDASIPGGPLDQLIGVFDAQLSGNRLLMTGYGVGLLDIPTQQFTLLAPGRRSGVAYAEFDPYENVLLTKINVRSGKAGISLLDAASGFSNAVAIETGSASKLSYRSCGAYLQRALYASRPNSPNGISAIPNPLKANGPAASQPLPEAAASQGVLVQDNCDATRAVWAIGRSNGQLQIFAAPFTG